MEDIELCSVLAARLARVTSVYVQLRIVHLGGCETILPPNILEYWCAVKCNLCNFRPLLRVSILAEDFFFTGKGVSQDYNVQGRVSELDGRSNSVYLFFKNLLGHTVIS